MGARTRPTPAPVPTPATARWTVGVGGSVALLGASAISFQTLAKLGDLLGILPSWLLPIAIDVYAATATVASLLLPALHSGRQTAIWNARLALSMSVIGNAVFHGLRLGSWSATDIVLTVISAWPPLIVERLLHLQGRLAAAESAPAEEATERASGDRSNARKPKPQRSHPEPNANEQSAHNDRSHDESTDASDRTEDDRSGERSDRINDGTDRTLTTATGRPSMDRWAQVGRPVYETLARELGKRPPEKAYRDALAAEADRLIAAGQLPAFYADPSVPAAKRVRAEVEKRFPGIARLRPVPDDLREAS